MSASDNPARAVKNVALPKARALMPVLDYPRRELLARGVACPESWPFAPFEKQNEWCERNHSQDAETLARRGGLSPAEALAILEGRHYYPRTRDDDDAIPKVAELLRARGDT